jgi:hypothetical protein
MEVAMNLATVAQMSVRASGVVLLILGVIFWTGNLDSLHLVHILLGLLLVLGLWTLAFLGARAGAPAAIVVVSVVWGLITPALGLTQENILTGGWHWVIQVLHLLVGLGAIGLAEQLARMIKARTAAAARPA